MHGSSRLSGHLHTRTHSSTNWHSIFLSLITWSSNQSHLKQKRYVQPSLVSGCFCRLEKLNANADFPLCMHDAMIVTEPLQNNEPLLIVRNLHHYSSPLESTFLVFPCSSAPSSSSRARFFDPASATAPGGVMAVSTTFSSFFAGLSVASFNCSWTFEGLSFGCSALSLLLSSDPGLVVLTLGTPLLDCQDDFCIRLTNDASQENRDLPFVSISPIIVPVSAVSTSATSSATS